MERVQNRQAIGFVTPLRYPGGKRKLFPFFRDLIKHNGLLGAHYIEPFTGGAGLALSLLISGYVEMIHLNDLDVAIYAFWKTVLEKPDKLCKRIMETPINMRTWEQQRKILDHPDEHTEIDVAFAAFFLNRTNRSGILRGGVIGGIKQAGKWKMDARFNKKELVRRIRHISTYRDRIRIYNQEAMQFLRTIPRRVSITNKCLVYADPPYYAKGHTLYYNHYRSEDHFRLAQTMMNLPCPWIVSYDDVENVYTLYNKIPYLRYQLHYSAQIKRRSGEVMFFQGLEIPPIVDTKLWYPMYVLKSSVHKKTTSACTDKSQVSR